MTGASLPGQSVKVRTHRDAHAMHRRLNRQFVSIGVAVASVNGFNRVYTMFVESCQQTGLGTP